MYGPLVNGALGNPARFCNALSPMSAKRRQPAWLRRPTPRRPHLGAVGSCDGSGGASYVVRLQSGRASVTQPGVNPGDTLVSDVFYNGVTSIAEAEIRDLTNGANWHSEAAEPAPYSRPYSSEDSISEAPHRSPTRASPTAR